VTECPNCAGTGFCPSCKGDGLVMAWYTVDVCRECQGIGQVHAGGHRVWCPGCGGSGKQLLYEELVQCLECVGDGSCIQCGGQGAHR
jgi:hypothetical protein